MKNLGLALLVVIVPSVNSVVEAWYPKVVPEGVSVHFARMLMPAGTSPERIIEMDRTDGRHAITGDGLEHDIGPPRLDHVIRHAGHELRGDLGHEADVTELRVAGDRSALTPTIANVNRRVVVQQLLGEHGALRQTGGT